MSKIWTIDSPGELRKIWDRVAPRITRPKYVSHGFSITSQGGST